MPSRKVCSLSYLFIRDFIHTVRSTWRSISLKNAVSEMNVRERVKMTVRSAGG
jgi:hypothetical protein